MDRDKVIKKLKGIKDPAERDRIMWALAGKEKGILREKPASIEPQRTAPAPGPKQAQTIPKFPADVRKIFNYVVPGFFLLFGFINLIQAFMNFRFTGRADTAFPHLIMGIIFCVFGILGIIKARKRVQDVDEDQKKT